MNVNPVSAVIAFTLATTLLLPACSRDTAPPPMPPPPQVSVAAVVVKPVTAQDEFTGRIEAVESVELRPRVSGHIDSIKYTEGSEVARGDVLFVIDARSYQAAHDLAVAELESARVQELLARTELERARKLIESKTISVGEFDLRRATHAQAEAGVRAAEAALKVAALNLEFTKVRAPISGRAGRALVTTGNLVAADPGATLLTTLVSVDPVHVHFDSDEQTWLRYQALDLRNAPVRVGLAGEHGFPHAGRLDFIDNRVDPATGTIHIRALLPNPDRVLTPGLFARVQLLAGKTFDALLIDDKAVLTDQDRKYVYVVGADGLAMRRDIRTGRLVDGLRIVDSGLEPGDRIIVHGVQKVFFPGMPVQAQEIAMGDPPPPPPGPPGGMTH